jgi:hypothetical protein
MDYADQGLEGSLKSFCDFVWRQNADLLRCKLKPFTQNYLQAPPSPYFRQPITADFQPLLYRIIFSRPPPLKMKRRLKNNSSTALGKIGECRVLWFYTTYDTLLFYHNCSTGIVVLGLPPS